MARKKIADVLLPTNFFMSYIKYQLQVYMIMDFIHLLKLQTVCGENS